MNNSRLKDSPYINRLVDDLIAVLHISRETLFSLNQECTQDTLHSIEHDWNSALKYLQDYENNVRPALSELQKPKGSVFIILSYNEPLILSIIPVLNALVAGNKVIVRPSSKGQKIFNHIWVDSGVLEKDGLSLEIINDTAPDDLEQTIRNVNAVYFFGSHKVAQKISEVCARNFIEFIPEIETADCKIIYYDDIGKPDLEQDCLLTLRESFSHSGQICHRLQGAVLLGNIYNEYIDAMKKALDTFKQEACLHVSQEFIENSAKYLETTLTDIQASNPSEVISVDPPNSIPLLVISPDKNSNYILGAYFLPIFWIISVPSEQEAIAFLNRKKYYLGLNIFSDSNVFIENIINQTKFTRYTINRPHTKIDSDEGWGGSWPSGYSGYKNWLVKFTNPYAQIR